MVTCQKKKAPLTTVNFLVPVTGGHCGPNGKWAFFFPVIFQSFESLSVVTDRHIKGLQPLFKVERIKACAALHLCTYPSSLNRMSVLF